MNLNVPQVSKASASDIQGVKRRSDRAEQPAKPVGCSRQTGRGELCKSPKMSRQFSSIYMARREEAKVKRHHHEP